MDRNIFSFFLTEIWEAVSPLSGHQHPFFLFLLFCFFFFFKVHQYQVIPSAHLVPALNLTVGKPETPCFNTAGKPTTIPKIMLMLTVQNTYTRTHSSLAHPHTHTQAHMQNIPRFEPFNWVGLEEFISLPHNSLQQQGHCCELTPS